MSRPDLLELWLAMLAVSGKGDDKAFASAQALFTGWYKKHNIAEQGDFHHRLALDHERWKRGESQ